MAISRVNGTDLLQQNYEKTSVNSFSDGEFNCVFDEPLSNTDSPTSTQTYPGLELSSNPAQNTQEVKPAQENTFTRVMNELLGKKDNTSSTENTRPVNQRELGELTKLMNGLLGKNEADAIKNEYGRSEINKLPNLENYNFDFDALARSLNYDNISGRQGSLEQKLNEIDRSIALLRLQAASSGSSIDPRLQALDTRIDGYRSQMPTSSANPANMTPVGPIEGVKDIQPGNFGGTNLSAEQINNVKAIASVVVKKAKEAGLSPSDTKKMLVIAIATAMQESTLKNINYGDRDSLGLFQQRPSCGWGTPEQVKDPIYATGKFIDGLLKVNGWQNMRTTDAAQKVQRSGFPEAYQKWEQMAMAVATALVG